MCWLASLSAPAQAKVVERIVSVVNDDIILLSELERKAKPLLFEVKGADEEAEQARDKIMREALDRMVDERLISQEATTLQLDVKQEEVDRAIDEIKRQNEITHDQLLEALAASGMAFGQYQGDMRAQILRLKVLNVLVRSRVNVTEEDARRYYEQNLRKSGADVRVRVRQIFVQIPANMPRAIVRDRRKRALALAKRVREGEAFGDVARSDSDDLLSRADGGDLGWVGRGRLPPEVEEAAFSMKPGDIRGPIYSDRGGYVIELLERKASQARPFDEIKEELRGQLAQEESERATRAWLVDVRRRSYVDVRY